MGATANARGLKRICMSCGMRFYDFNKSPIICPGCDVEFTGEVKVKSRRGRAAAKDDTKASQVKPETEADIEDDDVIDDDDAPILDDDDDVVSFDDLDDGDDDSDDDDDLGLSDSLDDLDEDENDDDDNDDKKE